MKAKERQAAGLILLGFCPVCGFSSGIVTGGVSTRSVRVDNKAFSLPLSLHFGAAFERWIQINRSLDLLFLILGGRSANPSLSVPVFLLPLC